MVKFCKSQICLSGKTVIVTGSNTGIGYQTALDLAKRGARVILACRNGQKAHEAKEKIILETSNKNVLVKLVDVSSLSSVRKFAEDVNMTEERLDILINNAGGVFMEEKITEDGLQKEIATNYFGPFLLTHLLLGLLKKSSPSRIVNVSSTAANFAWSLDVEDLNNYIGSSWPLAFRRYAISKLCQIYFTQILAMKLRGTGISVYSLHPGAISSDILRNSSFCQCVTKPFFLNTYEGAQTTIHVAVARDIEEYTGRHFENCKPVRAYWTARNRRKARYLWRKSENLVQLREDEKIIETRALSP